MRWKGVPARVRLPLLAAVPTALASLAAATAAVALPGTPIAPPIGYLAPVGFGTVPVTRGGLDVTFECPAYPSGGGGDYAVRFSNGDERGADGRLVAAGPYFAGEAPVQPGAQPGTCVSHLPLPSAGYPAALYLGVVAWQVSRRCLTCQNGWEVGPLAWAFLTPNVEGAELTPPRHLYAGYLSRFTFHATSDLAATEISLQGIGPKLGPLGWTDLARAPYDPAGENPLIVKLPAGHHRLRVSFYAGGVSQALPNQEFTIEKPDGRRSTGARDDGVYSSPPATGSASGPVLFEVTGGGRFVRDLRAPLPPGCVSATSAPGVAAAGTRIPSARVAPDGAVVGRAPLPGEPGAYATLSGRLRHRRFSGTLTRTAAACAGSREFEAAARSR